MCWLSSLNLADLSRKGCLNGLHARLLNRIIWIKMLLNIKKGCSFRN